MGEHALNAGFMHTRNFIDYHPPDRFVDSSLVVRDVGGEIAAVVPACEIRDGDHRVFFSHRGCTYGGLVVAARRHKAGYVVDIVRSLDQWLYRHGYDRAVLKLLGGIYTSVDSDLVEYALRIAGFAFDLELNSYVDLCDSGEAMMKGLSPGKRGHVRKCRRAGLEFRTLRSDDEVAAFHGILVLNLRKHGVSPVHTLNELLDFKNHRLPDTALFYGVYDGDAMLSGGMVYDYAEAGTLHTTYLAADPSVRHLSAATYLYYGIIEEARRMGRRRVAFGISTERQGYYLNRGLIHNKESYGSRHSVNRTAWKEYGGGSDAGS